MTTRIELLRDVVANGAQRIRINGRKVWVDAFTASACVQIHDALSETNRAKYIALPWPRFVDVTWKLVNRTGGAA